MVELVETIDGCPVAWSAWTSRQCCLSAYYRFWTLGTRIHHSSLLLQILFGKGEFHVVVIESKEGKRPFSCRMILIFGDKGPSPDLIKFSSVKLMLLLVFVFAV
jgi:hypothetical protein